jgi:hypothetical protein
MHEKKKTQTHTLRGFKDGEKKTVMQTKKCKEKERVEAIGSDFKYPSIIDKNKGRQHLDDEG